ncbi:Lipase Member J [Manis pentadactyla]|nr:Lipase Member J [Manis pentadactyla]
MSQYISYSEVAEENTDTGLTLKCFPLLIIIFSSNLGCLTKCLLLLPLFQIKRMLMDLPANIDGTYKQARSKSQGHLGKKFLEAGSLKCLLNVIVRS